MKIPVKLVGKNGIVPDMAQWDVSLDAFTFGYNVRFHNGRVQKLGGWQLDVSRPGLVDFFPWYGVDGNYQILIEATNIYRRNDYSTFQDISPASFTQGEWTFTQVGTRIILNAGVEPPLYMDESDSQLIPLPNWPADTIARDIKYFSGFLVAVNIQRAGTRYPGLVKWSDAVAFDLNGPPVWDHTDPSNLSNENPLPGNEGQILTQLELNGQNILYMENGVYTMSFVGGQFQFNFRKLFGDSGLINDRSVVEANNLHYCVGDFDIYAHDGNVKRSISGNRVRDFFFANLGNKASVLAVHHRAKKEIWFCYAARADIDQQPESDYFNSALLYDYEDNTWSAIRFPRWYRKIIESDTFYEGNSESWDDSTLEWDQSTESWNSSIEIDAELSLYMMDNTGDISIGDAQPNAYGEPYEAVIEQIGIDFDAAGYDLQSIKRIRSLVPQVRGTGTLTFQSGSAMKPNEGVNWRGAVEFDINADYKVDFRTTGRYLSLRMSSNNTESFDLSGWDLDVINEGSR